jgi:hypothetical protein
MILLSPLRTKARFIILGGNNQCNVPQFRRVYLLTGAGEESGVPSFDGPH